MINFIIYLIIAAIFFLLIFVFYPKPDNEGVRYRGMLISEDYLLISLLLSVLWPVTLLLSPFVLLGYMVIVLAIKLRKKRLKEK